MVREDEGAYDLETGAFELKVSLAETLVGGIIMRVHSSDDALAAEEAGAAAVVAVGGVAEIQKIQEAVSIPVIAICRVGHFAEAQIFEALFVDFIDESGPVADSCHHIHKESITIPFVCSCSDLGEALRRVSEGAALLRVGGATLPAVVGALRSVTGAVKQLAALDLTELGSEATRLAAPLSLVRSVAQDAALPVPLFAAASDLTPADVALLFALGAEAVITDFTDVESAKAAVAAAACYNHPDQLVRVSLGQYEVADRTLGEIGLY